MTKLIEIVDNNAQSLQVLEILCNKHEGLKLLIAAGMLYANGERPSKAKAQAPAPAKSRTKAKAPAPAKFDLASYFKHDKPICIKLDRDGVTGPSTYVKDGEIKVAQPRLGAPITYTTPDGEQIVLRKYRGQYGRFPNLYLDLGRTAKKDQALANGAKVHGQNLRQVKKSILKVLTQSTVAVA